MIEVTEILQDFDLCSAYVISRNTGGTFGIGGWTSGSTTTIPTIGAVRNTSGKELDMVPESDRARELLTFRSVAPMFVTNTTNAETSDVLVFQGDNYRVLAVKFYGEQGYWLAVATRMAGN